MSRLDDLASDAETSAYAALQRLRSEGYADGYCRALQEVARHLPAAGAPPTAADVQLANVRSWIDRTLRGAGAGRPFGTVPIVGPDDPTEEQVARAEQAFLAGQTFVGRAHYRDRLRRALRAALHG